METFYFCGSGHTCVPSRTCGLILFLVIPYKHALVVAQPSWLSLNISSAWSYELHLRAVGFVLDISIFGEVVAHV